MDAFDIFKKLRTGAKFDSKRFRNDAQKFQIGIKPVKDVNSGTEGVLSTKNKKRKLEDAGDVSKRKKTKGTVEKEEDETIQRTTSPKKRKKSVKESAKTRKEAVSRFRNENRIHIWGEDVPDPLETFSQLTTKYDIHGDVLNNIVGLGFPDPTPIQMQAIPVMMQKREILGCAPTGSGKTAAFLIPIIHHLKRPKKLGFRAVIVEPTRELARQVYLECIRLSEGRRLKIHVINKVNSAEKKFGPKSSQKFDILITTPNRLVFLLEEDKPIISLKNVEWLVIDESDKLFEAGRQGFRDQLAVIYKACTSPTVRHAMFSATFAYDVEQWCKLNLDNCVTVSIGNKNSAADTVDQELVFVGSEAGKLVAFRDLVNKGLTPPVLVFVQSKERAQELFTELIYDGINVEVIHSNRTQMQRDNVVKSFRCGKIWVLICTELMGRGIDFKGVNLVVNYDFPPSVISYIHRIGRTGRAGRKGRAITFFTEQDFPNLKSIANVMRSSNCPVPEFVLKMKTPKSLKEKRLAKKIPYRESILTSVPKYDEKQARYKRERLLRKKQREDAKSTNDG